MKIHAYDDIVETTTTSLERHLPLISSTKHRFYPKFVPMWALRTVINEVASPTMSKLGLASVAAALRTMEQLTESDYYDVESVRSKVDGILTSMSTYTFSSRKMGR